MNAQAENRCLSNILKSISDHAPENPQILAQDIRNNRINRHSKQEIFLTSAKLSETDRVNLLPFARNLPAGKNKDAVLLALYDEPAWKKYVSELTAVGATNRDLFTTLIPVIEGMPVELRARLWREIQTVYPGLSKGKNFNRVRTLGQVNLPPKRAIDLFNRLTINPNSLIQQSVEKGESALDGYRKYFSVMKTAFEGTPYAKYSADDVMNSLNIIQDELKKSGMGGEVNMFGSFPGGNANLLTSDIDLFANNPKFKELLPIIKERVNQDLSAMYGKTSLKVNVTPTFYNWKYMAKVNPIMFRVSENKIEMLLFPVSNDAFPLKGILTYKDPTPQIFPIK